MTKTPVFSQEEFDRRKGAIQQEMQRRGISLLLLDQPETIAYVIGVAMSEGYQQFCAIPASGDPIMVLRSVDEGTCQEFSWLPRRNIIAFSDWESPIEVLLAVVGERGLDVRRIGVDRNSYNLTLSRFDALREALVAAFGVVAFEDFSDFMTDLRAQKSSEELVLLQRSSKIADVAITALLEENQVGFSARQCMAIAASHIIRLGGDLNVPGVITRAIDDTKMHGLVDAVPLKEGALLHVELIPQFQGYASRIMRPVYFGEPPADLKETAAKIVGIQDRQFAAMRPGAVACDVDAVVRQGMLEACLKTSYRNISGYSLGYYQHFTARSSDFTFAFRPNDRWMLREGMVFHMYTVAKGLAFSDTVVVTKDGAERLTLAPRNILSVSIKKVH